MVGIDILAKVYSSSPVVIDFLQLRGSPYASAWDKSATHTHTHMQSEGDYVILKMDVEGAELYGCNGEVMPEMVTINMLS